MKTTDKQPGFEQSLKRLETIVQAMENGDLSLEKMMKDFEEGMALVKSCGEKLNEVERRIEILVQKNGQTVAETFPEPANGGPAPDAAE